MRLRVYDVGTVALDVWRAARDLLAEMVLGDDLHGEVVFEDGDVGVAPDGSHQAALDLEARVVLVVEDAKLGVAALAMEVKRAILFLVEVDTPFHEILDGCRSVFHHMFHGGGVGDPVACHHGVVDVLVEVVHGEIGDRGYAALCLGGVGLVEGALADDGDRTLMGIGNFESKAHTGHATADDEEIVMIYHVL